MSSHDCIPLPRADQPWVQVDFKDGGEVADQVHLLTLEEIHAINAAIAAGRPLLVRGEPGTGKSQLARAAAKMLGRVFISHVVDSQTESRDLLWSFDAVHRLAEAQLAAALRQEPETVREGLQVARFVQPGPLWWAFDWPGASKQAALSGGEEPTQNDGGVWKNGSVFLLDEIDKAEPEVPNGLLGVLGNRVFTPKGHGQPVRANETLPLVIITTNEERALPDAFLRRCLVLHLQLPQGETDLKKLLMQRGQAHFPQAGQGVLKEAADLLHTHRRLAAEERITPLPGQAEYLDLLRAVLKLGKSQNEQITMLQVVARFTLKKNADPKTLV
ncbi:MAG: ATPase AAA [Magnetococcales bacterium]|nr:ATPase AAA [Magnetococcales bacterium]